MNFGNLNVGIMYMPQSQKGLEKCRIVSMVVQNVIWGSSGPEPAHDYTSSLAKLINFNNQ